MTKVDPMSSKPGIRVGTAEGWARWLETLNDDDRQVIRDGLSDGICLWLVDHPISAHGVVEAAIRTGVRSWLDEHKDEIMEMIAREVRP